MSESIEQLEKKKKSGGLAAGLNILLPGLGYIYCGRILLGIFVFPLVLVLVFTIPMGAIGIWTILIVDGFLCADRYNKKLDQKIKETMKTCPACAEKVLPAAKVCKHCGHKFRIQKPSSPLRSSKPKYQKTSTQTQETAECPYCNKKILVSSLSEGDNLCPHCQQIFNVE